MLIGLLIPLSIAITVSCSPEADADLPEAYRTIEVPDRLDSEAAIDRGRDLFRQHCALCHGERGDGSGVRSANLSTAPRDFTSRSWARSTTPRKIYFAIREGVRGTAMPSWKSLEEEQCWDLVAYILSLSEG